MISKRCSEVIDRIKFPFATTVIILHAYTVVNAPNTGFAWDVIYLFSLILGEMGVPSFFFISGLLFFRKINQPEFSFAASIKSRISSLLLPYLIWNSMMIAFYWCGQNISCINSFFTGIIPSISQMSLGDILRLYWDRGYSDCGNFMPVLTPLWYVRNLFIVSLLSPILFILLKYSKGFILLFFGYLWLTTNNLAFIEVTLLFFSIGAWCSIKQVDFLNISKSSKIVILLISISLVLLDLYFHTLSYFQYKLIIHRLTLAFGIYAVILLVSQNIESISRTRRNSLAKYSFFLYLAHYPIMQAIRKAEMKYFYDSDSIVQLALYFSSIIFTIGTCLLIYSVLERYTPNILAYLLGSRTQSKHRYVANWVK